MKSLRWSRWGLLSMCCAASVFAAEGESPAELFEKLDANKDGQITADEVPEEGRPHFERLVRRGDKDANKSLSKDEWIAAHTPDATPESGAGGPGGRGEGRGNAGQFFERLDANKDGKVSKNEIPAEAPEQFRDMLNRVFEKSGKDELSREELTQAMGQMMRERGGNPQPGSPQPGSGQGRGSGQMLEMLKQMDKNGDGKVTLDEVPEDRRERLKGLMERLGGGDSIDLKRAEQFAAQMGRPGEGRPDGGPRPEGDRPRPEGERRPEGRDGERRPPEGAPRGEGRPDGDRPRGEGRMPEESGSRNRDGGRGPDGQGPQGGLLSVLDENHDGRLSQDEFSKAAAHFAALDQNHDGSLDPRELMGPPPRGGQPGRDMGPEGRGPRPEGDRERMRDGDRPAPRGEGDRPRPDGEGRGPRPEGDGPRLGPNGERRPEGAAGQRPNMDDFWKQLDKDGDGAISKEEAPERMKENFDSIDTNKDGKIDREEIRANMERRFGSGGRAPGAEGPGRGGRGDRPAGDNPERGRRPAAEDPKPEGDKPAEKPAE